MRRHVASRDKHTRAGSKLRSTSEERHGKVDKVVATGKNYDRHVAYPRNFDRLIYRTCVRYDHFLDEIENTFAALYKVTLERWYVAVERVSACSLE